MAVKRIWECDGCGLKAESEKPPTDWWQVFIVNNTLIKEFFLGLQTGERRDCCKDCAMRADPKNWQRKKSTAEVLAEMHRESLKQSVVRD